MENLSPNKQISALEHWDKLRNYFINRILIGFVILAIIGLPISVSCSFFYGWQPVYTVQSITAVCIVFLYLFRAKLPFYFKSGFLITNVLILTLMGLGTFGLSGGGVLFLILLQFLVASIYRPRTALIWFIFTFAILMIIGIGFVSGSLKLQVDFNNYMTNISSWASVWMLLVVIGAVAFRAMGVVQHTLLTLLQEVEEQRDKISHLANHDQLTGLPTMRLAQDRLEMAIHHAERNNEKVAVLFIDLDSFKKINDDFGHECGDYVLKEIAKRMIQIVRAEDTVARRSGDEFLVILGNMINKQYISIVAKKIIAEISQPIKYDDVFFTVSASIGISIFPDNAHKLEELKRLADKAMYEVKNARKDGFSFSESFNK